MSDRDEIDEFGRPKRIKVNPSYLYEGLYPRQREPMPRMRAVAVVLFIATAVMVLITGLGAGPFGGALSVIFLVAGICFWVAGKS